MDSQTHQSSAMPPLWRENWLASAVQGVLDHTSHMLPIQHEALPALPGHIGTLEGKPGAPAIAEWVNTKKKP